MDHTKPVVIHVARKAPSDVVDLSRPEALKAKLTTIRIKVKMRPYVK